jgi:hypothetical protein
MAILKLTGGQQCQVDDEDLDFLSQWKWRLGSGGYARRTQALPNKKKAIITMHRLIISAQRGEIVDHLNRVRLDNRRSNLRIVDYYESAANRTNGHFLNARGVTIHRCGRFQVQFKGCYIGLFATIEAAIEAYQKATTK